MFFQILRNGKLSQRIKPARKSSVFEQIMVQSFVKGNSISFARIKASYCAKNTSAKWCCRTYEQNPFRESSLHIIYC